MHLSPRHSAEITPTDAEPTVSFGVALLAGWERQHGDKSPTTYANFDTVEGVQTSCTLSFRRDYDGEFVNFIPRGDGSMTPAYLNFTSLTGRITDFGDVPGLFTKQASLFLDIFRHAVNPDPRIWTCSTTASEPKFHRDLHYA